MLSQPAVPETAPVCPDHAGEPTTGTCERCGRFLCNQCTQPAPSLCVPCHARQLRTLPHTSGRAKWTRGALYTGVAVAAVTGLLHAWLILNLENGSTPSLEDAQAYDSLNVTLTLASSVVMITTVISYLRWLHLSVKTAVALGVSAEEPRWAVFAWFIPFYNLVKPYEVVRDLWLNLGGAPAQRALLKGWWAAWLIGNGVSNVSASLFNKIGDGGIAISTALTVGMISEALSVLSSVLCIRVIEDIESMIAARRADLDTVIAQAEEAQPPSG